MLARQSTTSWNRSGAGQTVDHAQYAVQLFLGGCGNGMKSATTLMLAGHSALMRRAQRLSAAIHSTEVLVAVPKLAGLAVAGRETSSRPEYAIFGARAAAAGAQRTTSA